MSAAAAAMSGVGLILIGISAFMALAPRRALRVLARFGSTPGIHFGEMGLRALLGLILILGASSSRHPLMILTLGVFLVSTAAILSLLPRRWHLAYSTWWAARLPIWSVRLSALGSTAAGVALIWSANPGL